MRKLPIAAGACFLLLLLGCAPAATPVPAPTHPPAAPGALQTAPGATSAASPLPPAAEVAASPVAPTAEVAVSPVAPTETPTRTETPTPAGMPVPAEVQLALGFGAVARNADWTPVISELDGVWMALVPAGCFDMGSTAEQVDDAIRQCEQLRGAGNCERSWFLDEQPAHGQCFEEPFWIDVYEVTNAQYGSPGEWQGDELPREQIGWADAMAHCESRGARLPTEAEWEYAARGPDGLVFPWGDLFLRAAANTCDASCEWNLLGTTVDDGYPYTAPVGSYAGGASWVGAMDMSGNVWEWTSSLHIDYPYDAADGREVDGGTESGGKRVLRGGSWYHSGSDLLRSAARYAVSPDFADNAIGFRCAVASARSATPAPPPPSPAVTATPGPGQPVRRVLGDSQSRPADGMMMVFVPAGEFMMGSTEADIDVAFELCELYRGVGACRRLLFEDEAPAHRVSLDSYWIDETEVTNAQYTLCVEAGACRPANCEDEFPIDGQRKPACCVTWQDAQTYCQWAGARLPTEAEWEYAARGPDGANFPWGDSFDPSRLNYCDINCTYKWHDMNYDDGYSWPAPVGTYETGVSWCGAQDMAGNSWEWVADWYDAEYYASSPASNPQGPDSGTERVIRGGSAHFIAPYQRSANRSGIASTAVYASGGFRCAAGAGALWP